MSELHETKSRVARIQKENYILRQQQQHLEAELECATYIQNQYEDDHQLIHGFVENWIKQNSTVHVQQQDQRQQPSQQYLPTIPTTRFVTVADRVFCPSQVARYILANELRFVGRSCYTGKWQFERCGTALSNLEDEVHLQQLSAKLTQVQPALLLLKQQAQEDAQALVAVEAEQEQGQPLSQCDITSIATSDKISQGNTTSDVTITPSENTIAGNDTNNGMEKTTTWKTTTAVKLLLRRCKPKWQGCRINNVI
jgi:hypothetical protein